VPLDELTISQSPSSLTWTKLLSSGRSGVSNISRSCDCGVPIRWK
jgi:hypothetical protein